jgi:hypothetical protein
VQERPVEVVRVRVEQKVSYAEAVTRVVDDGSGVSSRPIHSDMNLCFGKVGFLVFIAMVINCATVMARKSQKIAVVVAAAEKYLGVQGFTVKETRC